MNWLLMILGEALTAAVRDDPDLEQWIPEARAAIGLRNRIVHGYDSVDDRIIWNLVQEKLPILRAQVGDVLGR